jgi:hypothetical protein
MLGEFRDTQMVMRSTVRLVLIGSLSLWQARPEFSRIEAESGWW